MAAVYWFVEMFYLYFQCYSTNEMCVGCVKKRRESPLTIVGWSSEILCTG